MRALDEWKIKLSTEESPAAAEMIDIEYENALDAAQSAGWKGVADPAPYMFVLPNQVDFQFGFVLNASTEQTTTMFSPLSLHWLAAASVVAV